MRVLIDSMAHLPLSGLTDVQVCLLQRRLTKIPLASAFEDNPTPIMLYKMGLQSIAIPREYFFLNHRGDHEVIDMTSSGAPMNEFNPIKLRQNQVPTVGYFMEHIEKRERFGGILCASTGVGKCHKKGTEIIMYDGSVKSVEDINVGDQLMGPDSNARNVMSLSSGREEMFDIIPIKGDVWGCNKSHILSLKLSGRSGGYKRGDIVNISIDEYLKKDDNFKHVAKLYRVPIDFKKQEVEYDPYWLGVWLGDGSKALPHITNPDKEIIKYLKNFANEHGFIFENRETREGFCPVWKFTTSKTNSNNPLYDFIKTLVIDNEKRIPKNYLINSRENRLKLLAGLLDTDGHLLHHKSGYEIITKYDGLRDDILYLCRTLGFAAYSKIKKVKLEGWGDSRDYHRISISGHCDEIPCLIDRKKAHCRKQKKDFLVTGFSLESKGEGDYYGFTLDGDHLYCLWDTTVTHNTIMALEISRRLGRATLIKVYKEDLADQWIERIVGNVDKNIKGVFPGAKVGRIQGDVCIFKDCDFVIAMIQTLVSRKDAILKHSELTNYFGTEITDEIHRTGSEGWGGTAEIFNARDRIGLTATPRRKDGCEDVFKFHIGQIVVTSDAKVMEPNIFFRETCFNANVDPDDDFQISKLPMPTQMKIMSRNHNRNRIIANDIVRAIEAGRKVIAISKFVDHLQRVEEIVRAILDLRAEKVNPALKTKRLGFYVGALYTGEVKENKKGDKIKIKIKQTKEQLEEAAECDVLFATYKKAEDALDVPALDTLVMMMPISDPEQVVGRILRTKDGKRTPLVVDICDSELGFASTLRRSRVGLYEKKGWSMKVAK